MKVTRKQIRTIIENTILETRYRDKKYRRASDISDMIVGDAGPTEFYKPSDPIRGPGNIYMSIRSNESAMAHGRRQIAHAIQALGLNPSNAKALFQAMNTYGYMIDYDPSAMTITFENKSDVSNPYVLDVSHLL